MNQVVQNVGPEQGLKGPPIHHITRAVEEFANIEFEPGLLKDAHRPVLVEIHQHVNVAFGAGFTPRHGTKHRGVRHPEPPQITLMGAECFQHVLEVQFHSPP